MAVICGTPTPDTIRVVQMEPGPTPTLTTSTPASINAVAPSAVATLPPAKSKSGIAAADLSDHVDDILRMAVGGVHGDQINAGANQCSTRSSQSAPYSHRRANPQPAPSVLAGVGELQTSSRCP